ncbi:MAG: hypothetical protein ACLTUN_09515 [Paraclostridium sordellii]
MKNIKLILIVAVIILSPLLFPLFKSNSYSNEKDYLSKNNKPINLKNINDFSGLEILKDDLKNKKIIFTGEDHTLDKDNLFKIKMIKYLQKKIDLKYYLDESGYANAYFFNKYLNSGDEKILKQAFNQVKGTAMYNTDDYNFYKSLYEFNQTLSEDKRIEIIGIDIEHGGLSSCEYLIDIMKNKDLKTEPLDALLTNLKKYSKREIDAIQLRDINQNLIDDAKKNENEYKDIFGENIEDFKYLLNNLEAMCVSYSSEEKDWNNVRDKYIYDNFKYIDSKLKDAKYFGQWGGAHVYQDTFHEDYYDLDYEYIASLLNKDPDYTGKIISIQYGYSSKVYMDLYSKIDKNLFNDYINSGKDVLFKLNGKNSPFSKDFIYPLYYKPTHKNNQVTTDLFQYIMLINDVNKSNSL